MSSILDAVTKDASRSGSIPGAAGNSPLPPLGEPGGAGPGPSRFRSLALVVVVGVTIGAAAARMFGSGEPPPDDLLTDKAATRADGRPGAKGDSARVAAADPVEKGHRKSEDAHSKGGARKKDAAVAAAPAAPPVPAAPPSPPPLVIPAPAVAAKPAEPAVTPPAAMAVQRYGAAGPAVVTGDAKPPAAPAAEAVVAAKPAPAATPEMREAAPVVAEAKPAAPAIVTGVAAAPSAVAGAETGNVATAEVAAPAPVGDASQGEAANADEAAAPSPPPDAVLDEKPAGAPEVSILFVAWSRTPTDSLVSMRVGTGSLSVVHEGEYIEGMQVSAIHPEAVDFQWTGQKFRVPIRPF